ncbi:tannase/feruloyl esterase family alpha/beta hydrolase [Mycobacterium sp. CBMA361]|nr:tannase/feruloyl esterase family alpha/beta hydrolase [Mycolicibacterium sp. CBMA 361]
MVTNATEVHQTDTDPGYCRVDGAIAALDPNAQPILFSMALPTDWNSKLMHVGGGGWDGKIPDLLDTESVISSGPSPLHRGYAVVASNSGHSSPRGWKDASFTLNEEELHNFAGDQLKKTRDVAKVIVTRRYGKDAQRTYFQGGSEGGRESMVVIQRFPEDYDGVVSAYPVFNWLSSFLKWQLVSRAMRLDNGAGWLNENSLNVLRTAELAACDELDGARDGLISNVAACNFDPRSVLCAAGANPNTCLTDAQVATVEVMHSSGRWPYELTNGQTFRPRYYPGTSLTSDAFGTEAQFTTGGDFEGLGEINAFADSLIRYVLKADPSAGTLDFDPMNPGPLLSAVQAASATFDQTSTDIQRYLDRGGKWIIVHGLSDELPMASATVDYYRSLQDRFGGKTLDKSVRFYAIPGYAHGHGDFDATHGIPLLDALESWVEAGQAPGDLTATDTNENAHRTRPACMYPTWPRYTGSGSLNSASSFECAAPK